MKNKYSGLFIIAAWVVTVVFSLYYILSSNISFWLDPARDLLSAWSNLHKITLIGPPSGIPGFFYGPYWIWWLSFGMLFSKNPAVIIFICMTIPYLFIFAGVLLLFSKLFGKTLSIFLWLLFFISFRGYVTQLWNPYLAPILFLCVIYMLVFSLKKIQGFQSLLPIFLSGFLSGVALNIHISFSIGFTIGCMLYLFFIYRKYILSVFFCFVSFILGITIAFVPFFLFEFRHGFRQSRVAITTLLHGGGVVSQHGLSRVDILRQFVLQFGTLLSIPFIISIIISVLLISTCVFLLYKNQNIFTQLEKNLLLLLSLITCCVLGIYLLARNPIWDYHFIGTEVLWLLFLGIIVRKVKILTYLLFGWVIIQVLFSTIGIAKTFHENPLKNGSLYTKEYIVKTIQSDARNNDYAVYAYSISIYTYEYEYLFKWQAGKDFSFDPHQIPRKPLVYIILPPGWPIFLEDFTNNHTPPSLYKTAKIWHIPDGTTILKRVAVR